MIEKIISKFYDQVSTLYEYYYMSLVKLVKYYLVVDRVWVLT